MLTPICIEYNNLYVKLCAAWRPIFTQGEKARYEHRIWELREHRSNCDQCKRRQQELNGTTQTIDDDALAAVARERGVVDAN